MSEIELIGFKYNNELYFQPIKTGLENTIEALDNNIASTKEHILNIFNNYSNKYLKKVLDLVEWIEVPSFENNFEGNINEIFFFHNNTTYYNQVNNTY